MADDAAESDDGRGPSATDSDAHDTDGDRWTSDDWESLNRERDSEESDAGDEYRIPLDLSADESKAAEESDAAEDEDDDPYGPEPRSTPIEPGDPSLENVIFVFLGVVAMILVLFRVMSLPL